MIVDWGFNGTFFDADMARIEGITKKEAQKYRYGAAAGTFVWQRSTSVHPHMVGSLQSFELEKLVCSLSNSFGRCSDIQSTRR